MCKSIHRTLAAILGKKRYTFYDAIKAVPYGPRAEIETMQLRKLQRLLVHAAENVPYYGDLFRETGFDPREAQSVDALKRLPTLNRDTVRANIDSMVARNFPRHQLNLWSTGGSTGTPVSFYKEKDCLEMEMALMWRSWSWAGWTPPDRMVWIWGAPQETSQLASLRGAFKWRLGGRLLFDAFNMGSANLAQWVDKINAFGATHVIGYATSLTTFATFLLKNRIRLNGPFRQVVSTAEKLREEQRKTIEEAFQTKVYDQYGCREIRITAFECARGNMHIISDSCVMEFVPGAGIHEGAQQIVCTSLNNYAMPLIRYEVGDYGSAVEGECPCGIGFPMMKLDIGRVTDNFVLPNGRIVHGEYYTHLMYGIEGIRSFQFHQKEISTIRLYVVPEKPDARPDLERRLAHVRQEVEAMSHGLELRIEFMDHIPPTRSGKHLFTVCEVDRT